jgi:hypothetical protein
VKIFSCSLCSTCWLECCWLTGFCGIFYSSWNCSYRSCDVRGLEGTVRRSFLIGWMEGNFLIVSMIIPRWCILGKSTKVQVTRNVSSRLGVVGDPPSITFDLNTHHGFLSFYDYFWNCEFQPLEPRLTLTALTFSTSNWILNPTFYRQFLKTPNIIFPVLQKPAIKCLFPLRVSRFFQNNKPTY